MTRPAAALLAALAALAGPAAAETLRPIQEYVDARGWGRMDHAYPLVRCGALYMTSVQVAGADLPAERAEQILATAQKMLAIASSFRLAPGDDPERTANGVMDEAERLMTDYQARGGGRAFGGDALVKKDFRYCRTVSEPFVRGYRFEPPPG
jgi:hypothetical protein